MADLILFNANIVSMPLVSPNEKLVAIQNGSITSVTTNDALGVLKNRNTTVIDCTGTTVLPGFFDAHLHLHAFAESLVTLSLTPGNDIRSISDIQSRIRALSKRLPAGSWIRGKGYHEFHLAEQRHPDRWDLDAAAPDHPIKLSHRSGHAHVLNSLALNRVGITGETSDPPGGLVDRSIKTGEPNGVLYEMGGLLSERIPSLDSQELKRGIKMANQHFLSMGITSVQDASSQNTIGRWHEFCRWKEDGLLLPRVNMFFGLKGFDESQKHDGKNRPDVKQLRVNGVKIILDKTTGELHPPQSELNEAVLTVHRAGMQVAIHAIEEVDIESACNAIAYAQKEFYRPDHRHRIEHCSVCTPALAKRIASLGMMVVTQPPFIYYNGDRYLKTVPDEQINHLYPIGTLLKSGITVAGSSDCPVVSANPFAGMYAAMSRATETGGVLLPEEKITFPEALMMYTGSAAKATFEERIKGSIIPGKLADLVIVKGELARLQPHEMRDTVVEMTIFDGKIAWRKNP